MARGTFDDFTSKYGFTDGETLEERDFLAREYLIKSLNKVLKNQVAVPFDRPGVHNACLILFLKKRRGYKGSYEAGFTADPSKFEVCDNYEVLPDAFCGESAVQHAYDMADRQIQYERDECADRDRAAGITKRRSKAKK